MAELKIFVAFVNGVIRQDIFKEEGITEEIMKVELFPNLNVEEFQIMLKKTRKIVNVRIITHCGPSLGSYSGYTLCSFPLTWTQPVAQEALYTLVTKCRVVAAVCQLNAHCFKIMVLVDLIEHGKIQHGHEPS